MGQLDLLRGAGGLVSVTQQELAPSQSTQKDMFVLVASDKYAAMKTETFKVVKVSKYASKSLPT